MDRPGRWILALALFACHRRETPTVDASVPDVAIGPPAAVPARFTLLAKNQDVWAYRRSPRGPITLARAHDFSRVGSFELHEELESEKAGGALPTARICTDGRFAILSFDDIPKISAHVWDPKDGSQREISLSGAERILGWSDACEVVAFGPKEPPPAGRDGAARAPLLVLGLGKRATFGIETERDEQVSLLDASKDSLLVSFVTSPRRRGEHRLATVDRESSNVRRLPRPFYEGSSWTRIDTHSYAVVPSFDEGPYVVRADRLLSPDAEKALAAPDAGPAAALTTVLDPHDGAIALFDGKRFARWSLKPRRRVASREVEAFPEGPPIVSDDGLRLARGNAVLDLTTGAVQALPLTGELLGFAGGHDRIVTNELVFSIAAKKVAGRLPD